MDKEAYKKYICRICGFIYDEEQGDADGGLAPGTRFEDIPADWTCPLCGVSKLDMILLEDYFQQQHASASVSRLHLRVNHSDEKNAIVIIGAGIAGWALAAELRAHELARPIILIAAGSADYYPKPSLSMAFSQQRHVDELVEISGHDKALELNVVLREHTRVVAINTKRKRVLSTRGSITYGDVVLAVGAEQIPLQVDGDACNEVLRINDLQSYQTLRGQLQRPGQRITIIGAGLIGCELAEDLTTGGFEVTLVDRMTRPLKQLLPAPIAESLRQRLTRRGIGFLPNMEINRIERSAGSYLLQSSGGQNIRSDVVISALGLRPLTRLARKAGIDFQFGIKVDPETMQTSQAHVYALGDCAQVHQTCYAYIEPIHRQAISIVASLSGERRPFQEIAPLIRVKTPSLPLSVCPPPTGSSAGYWKILDTDAQGYHMQYLVSDVMVGFALSGNFTHLANRLYAEIKQRVQALSAEQAVQEKVSA